MRAKEKEEANFENIVLFYVIIFIIVLGAWAGMRAMTFSPHSRQPKEKRETLLLSVKEVKSL